MEQRIDTNIKHKNFKIALSAECELCGVILYAIIQLLNYFIATIQGDFTRINGSLFRLSTVLKDHTHVYILTLIIKFTAIVRRLKH